MSNRDKDNIVHSQVIYLAVSNRDKDNIVRSQVITYITVSNRDKDNSTFTGHNIPRSE